MMNTCGICLDEVSANPNQITTKCGHCFHNKCITQWLLKKHTCPLCREKIYEPPQDYDSEDEEDEEIEYHIHLRNSIITLDDSIVTKITQRILDLTEHIDSNYELPLKHNWYIVDYQLDINNQLEFSTYVNTKKYKCMTKFQVYTYNNDIFIDISSLATCKCHDRQIRMLRYGYQKWRTRNINYQTSFYCF